MYETKHLLPSLTTSDKVQSFHRTLVYTRPINGLFAVALVLKATLASSTGKLETLGSSFSNETRNSEAACVLRYTKTKSNLFQRTLINIRPK